MPLYEYYCADCHSKTEVLRSMSKADDPIECRICHGTRTARAISLFSAYSKGDGSPAKAISGAGGGCASCGGSCAGCGAH